MDRMTLPAYVLQLLTNATGSVSALSGEQAGSDFSPPPLGQSTGWTPVSQRRFLLLARMTQ